MDYTNIRRGAEHMFDRYRAMVGGNGDTGIAPRTKRGAQRYADDTLRIEAGFTVEEARVAGAWAFLLAQKAGWPNGEKLALIA